MPINQNFLQQLWNNDPWMILILFLTFVLAIGTMRLLRNLAR